MQLDETKNESASRPTARANSRLLGFAFFSFLFFIILNRLATTTADVDLWGYLAFGRQFWTSGHFPYRDVFSYVPTLDPWVYHEWLTGVIFYPVYKFTGSAGLQVIKYLAGSATCWFVYLTARLRGANPLTSGLLIIMALQGWLFFGYAPVRAQVFTYLFFAVYIFLLERARIKQEWRYLLVLTFIQVLWCNLHGGFLAGLGLIGVYAVGEAISRRPFLPFMYALVFSTVVTLVNPYGFQYWAYLYRAVSMPRPEIWEWASIINAYISGNISWQEIMNPLATLVLVVFLAIRNRWRDITALLALAVTLYLGIKHIRHLVFFYLLMAAVGAFLGPRDVLLAALFTAIAGGVYAVTLLVVQKNNRKALGRLGAMAKGLLLTGRLVHIPAGGNEKATPLRYGVAIGIGTLAVLVQRII